MKILKIVSLISLFIMSSNAMTMKTNIQEEKTIYQVLKSEKKIQCVKPGLAVDFSYSSEHVNVGAISKVKFVLTTGINEGILNVEIKSSDHDLLELEEKSFEYKLSSEQPNIFPIDLEVSSEVDGEYYVTVFTSIQNKGGRIFEIPVRFGTPVKKPLSKSVSYTDDGTAIIVSTAEEEIK